MVDEEAVRGFGQQERSLKRRDRLDEGGDNYAAMSYSGKR